MEYTRLTSDDKPRKAINEALSFVKIVINEKTNPMADSALALNVLRIRCSEKFCLLFLKKRKLHKE